jgi:hypothetical protein
MDRGLLEALADACSPCRSSSLASTSSRSLSTSKRYAAWLGVLGGVRNHAIERATATHYASIRVELKARDGQSSSDADRSVGATTQ